MSMILEKPHAHGLRRSAHRPQAWRMLEAGSGCIDADRNIARVVMNRQPLGGYTG